MNKQVKSTQTQNLVRRVSLPAAAWCILALVSGWISPGAQQFFHAATPWVLMGIGIAGAATFSSLDEPMDR